MSLLQALLQRRDFVEIRRGELIVVAASGRSVPDIWLKENRLPLLIDIVESTGISMYQVVRHSVGNYGVHHSGGLTLQLCQIGSLEDWYTIFNVETKRARNTLAGGEGTPLPKGHFRVIPGSAFHKFWLRTGLKNPPRPSMYHDRLGKLKPLLLAGRRSKESKIAATSLMPAEISASQIEAALRDSIRDETPPGNCPASSMQFPDNLRATPPCKDIPYSPISRGFDENPTAGAVCYGKSSQGSAGQDTHLNTVKSFLVPEEQSVDEWLEDYAKLSSTS